MENRSTKYLIHVWKIEVQNTWSHVWKIEVQTTWSCVWKIEVQDTSVDLTNLLFTTTANKEDYELNAMIM